MRAGAVVGLLAWGVAACGGEGTLEVLVRGDPALGWEVRVYEGACPTAAEALEPDRPPYLVRDFVGSMGEAVGALPNGQYGFAALGARPSTCGLDAYGCVAVGVPRDRAVEIDAPTFESPVSRCTLSEVCEAGACVPLETCDPVCRPSVTCMGTVCRASVSSLSLRLFEGVERPGMTPGLFIVVAWYTDEAMMGAEPGLLRPLTEDELSRLVSGKGIVVSLEEIAPPGDAIDAVTLGAIAFFGDTDGNGMLGLEELQMPSVYGRAYVGLAHSPAEMNGPFIAATVTGAALSFVHGTPEGIGVFAVEQDPSGGEVTELHPAADHEVFEVDFCFEGSADACMATVRDPYGPG